MLRDNSHKKPFKPGASLPVLSDHDAEHTERVAAMAEDALGSSDPSLIAEVVAHLLCNTIGEHGIRDADAVEPLMVSLLADVMKRVDELGRAKFAIVKAMAAAKTSGH